MAGEYVMSTGYGVVSALLAVVCIILIILVLLQKNRDSGLGSAFTGSAGTQTFWDKNKSRSAEGKIVNYTKIAGIAFFVLTVLLGFMS